MTRELDAFPTDRDAAQFEPNIDIRDLVVAWFHDAEEICEHDEPPPACETMADHLLAAFTVSIRDWKAYAAPNRLSALAAPSTEVTGEGRPEWQAMYLQLLDSWTQLCDWAGVEGDSSPGEIRDSIALRALAARLHERTEPQEPGS